MSPLCRPQDCGHKGRHERNWSSSRPPARTVQRFWGLSCPAGSRPKSASCPLTPRVISTFITGSGSSSKRPWTIEETRRLFELYKELGTRWTVIVQEFAGRSENDVKNKFYTTLKRVATRAQLEMPDTFTPSFIKCKSNLLQFVDAAIECSHKLSSKRGRKKNSEKQLAPADAMVFPHESQPVIAEKLSAPSLPPATDLSPSCCEHRVQQMQPSMIVHHVVQPWIVPYGMPMPGMQIGGPFVFPGQFAPGGFMGGPTLSDLLRSSTMSSLSVPYLLPFTNGHV